MCLISNQHTRLQFILFSHLDNVLIENLPECIRRIRSIPKTISTSIAKEESRLIAIRNTDNDGNEITYARGDGIALLHAT